MTVAGMVWLGLTGGLFALWAVQMFRLAFALLRHARRMSGKLFPGPVIAVETVAVFLRAPDFRAARLRLLWLTVAVLSASAATPWVMGL